MILTETHMAKDVLYGELAEFYEPLYRKNLCESEDSIGDECDALEKIFNGYSSRKVKSVLDVGCGTGIHSIELARRGYSAVGFDYAPKMVDVAKRRVAEKKSRAEFFVGDMRDFSLGTKFDAVICMTNAFLCNSTDEEAEKALGCMAGALKSGGTLVLEVSNYLGQAAQGDFQPVTIDRTEKDGFEVVEISENEFDLPSGVLREKNTYFVSRGGKLFKKLQTDGALGLFTIKRAQPLLDKAGFRLVEVIDAETMERAGPDSYEYLVVAEKA